MDKELVQVRSGKIEIAENAMRKLHQFQNAKKEIDKTEKEIKQALLKAMRENGIKSFENDYLKATYIEPTTRTVVDTKALERSGLYDIYSKETEVKDSVRLKYKE